MQKSVAYAAWPGMGKGWTCMDAGLHESVGKRRCDMQSEPVDHRSWVVRTTEMYSC